MATVISETKMSRFFLKLENQDNQQLADFDKNFFKKSCENIWSVHEVVVILQRFSAHNMTNCVSDFFDAFFGGGKLRSLKCLQ